NVSFLPGNISIMTVNLSGRVFMDSIDCPFQVISRALDEAERKYNITIVDFHAEATSEKIAMGYYLDGKVTAVIGTHTHVQTADEKILPKGTGFITDVGMTGAFDSVIGMEKEKAIERFLMKMPQRFLVAKKDLRLSGVILDLDPLNGITKSIKRIIEVVP
ncbi:YmdB family metallophosphoesterase, partial [bacterium]|nr:YmdB family metallophosphoesterase [bacterium]